jgi:hypothetical protein
LRISRTNFSSHAEAAASASVLGIGHHMAAQALEATSPGVAAAAATMPILFTVVPVALVYQLLRRYELSML